MRLRFAHGFSLIELMIVLAIMGIVVMFAYPSYTSYVLKSHRTEAKSGLLDLAQKQEDYRADNNRYVTTNDELGKKFFPNNSDERTSGNGLYSFSVEKNSSPLGFTLIATAVDEKAQKDDIQCKKFTIDHQGTRSAENSTGTDNPDCW